MIGIPRVDAISITGDDLNTTYLLDPAPRDWNASALFCKKQGGKLLSPLTTNEAIIMTFMKLQHADFMWLDCRAEITAWMWNQVDVGNRRYQKGRWNFIDALSCIPSF